MDRRLKTTSGPLTSRHNLRMSLGDAASFGGMVGLGESYLPAFALAIGLGEVTAGLVASFPLLAGGILQAASPWAIRRIGSEKRWVVLCASLQAATFVPLVYSAWQETISISVLFLLATFYWAFGLASGPAWNTWIETLVPRRVRASFFASRTRLSQAATLIGFVVAGSILQWMASLDLPLIGFAIIFLAAAVMRLVSVGCLAQHRDTPTRPGRLVMPPVLATVSVRQLTVSGKRLLAYLVVAQGMVQISGPYFAPYLLQQLQFSYGEYMLLLTAVLISKYAALPIWANVAKERGAAWLLLIGAIGIVPTAALWIVSPRLEWLLALQLLAGIVWAAYELGFFLLFFETLPVGRRTRMLTFYNLTNSAAWFVGALTGGAILSWFGPQPAGYYALFAISSLGRLLALPLLIGMAPIHARVRSIGLRVLTVRPNSATLDAPILSSLPASSYTAPTAVGKHGRERGEQAPRLF